MPDNDTFTTVIPAYWTQDAYYLNITLEALRTTIVVFNLLY